MLLQSIYVKIRFKRVCKSSSCSIFITRIFDVERFDIGSPICILLFTSGILKRCVTIKIFYLMLFLDTFIM